MDLDASLLAGGTEDLDVGVDDLIGVDDLVWATADFGSGSVEREVGVEDLGSFDAVCVVVRPVGVAGLDELTLEPPDEDGLRIPEDEFKLADGASCLDIVTFLEEGSAGLANLDFKRVVWPFGVP